jgi:hypothetical protein
LIHCYYGFIDAVNGYPFDLILKVSLFSVWLAGRNVLSLV